jgi:hypothetical protein
MKKLRFSVHSLTLAVTLLLALPQASTAHDSELIDPANAAYEYVPGTYMPQSLGSFVESATLSNSLTFVHSATGEVHWFQLYYLSTKLNTNPFQILHLNLTTGQVRLVDGGFGRPDPSPMMPYPGTNYVYIPSQGPGYLTRYDVQTGEAKVIHRLADASPQGVGIGDDLNIYLGEAVKGYLERYDPRKDPTASGVAESWTNFGIVQDPGAPYYRYVYSLYSDGNYVYMAVRDQNRSPIWFFVVKSLATGEERVFLSDVDSTYTSSITTRRGYGVGCYSLPTGSVCKRFDGFNMGATVNPNDLPGTPVSIQWPSTFLPSGYQLDTSEVSADSSTNGSALVRWKKPGDSSWRSVSVPGVRMEPVPIKEIHTFSNGELIGFPTAYGPTFLFDAIKNKGTVLGRGILSMYNALYSARHGRWFIAGYPSVWSEYDPTKLWTLSYSTDRYNTATNPHFLPRPLEDQNHYMAKYYRHIREDAQGTIYLGGNHERDSTGGSLVWYNPASTKPGSIPSSWSAPWITSDYGVLREPFLQYNVRGLSSCLSGTKIVISTVTCCGGSGPAKLYVFDTGSKQIERSFQPLSLTDTGYIIASGQRQIFGASADQIYSIDIQDGSLLYSVKAPAAHAGKLRRGPDGYIWGFWGSKLYRVHPGTGAMQEVAALAASELAFLNQDLYLANGATLYRIAGLLKLRAAPRAPGNLRAQ